MWPGVFTLSPDSCHAVSRIRFVRASEGLALHWRVGSRGLLIAGAEMSRGTLNWPLVSDDGGALFTVCLPETAAVGLKAAKVNS